MKAGRTVLYGLYFLHLFLPMPAKKYLRHCLFIFSISLLTGASDIRAQFARGADVGWLSEMEAAGRKFYNSRGEEADCLQVLKEKGIHAIRLRVWVNPLNGWCGQDDVVKMAKRARQQGFRIMIDFHYSDSWADPGQQPKPAAWKTHSFKQLNKDVYQHTLAVLQALQKNGIYPEWVQVGNEITNGMLWPDGDTKHFSQLAQLVNSGYRAVKKAGKNIAVVVHVDRGFQNSLFRHFFDSLKIHGGRWDMIGISLYPDTTNWQQLDSLCLLNMQDMISRYHTPVMVCEVGMDAQAAVAGYAFLKDIIYKTQSLPDGMGKGVFYWEPESYQWKNYPKGAFDTNGQPTHAMDAFIDTGAAPH